MILTSLSIIFDPLEQFEAFPLILNSVYAPNNLTLILFINLGLIFFLMYTFNYQNQSHTTSPSVLSYFVQSIQDMLADLTEANISLSKQVYFPIISYIFWVVLISNLVGLIPFSYTITSSFAFTFYLSLSLFIGINILGIYQHSYAIFAFGLPNGSPLPLAPLIAVVELISYFSRIFSLSIRLFANMMAGHTLLKILIGFSWVMLNSQSVMILFAALPWTVVTLVMALEFVISFLQAYVYVTLITLYINDVIVLH